MCGNVVDIFITKCIIMKIQYHKFVRDLKMNLLKRYESRLNDLKNKKLLIEKEIEWVSDLLENLKKEQYKASRILDIKPEAESDEFKNIETIEAVKIVLNEAFPDDIHQKEIARELFRKGWNCKSKTPDQTVATALWRLSKKLGTKSIEKTGKGKYKLTKPFNNNGEKVVTEITEEEIPF